MRRQLYFYIVFAAILFSLTSVLFAESNSDWNWKDTAEAMDSVSRESGFPWRDPDAFVPYTKAYVAFGVNSGLGVDYYDISWSSSYLASIGVTQRLSERMGVIGAITLKRFSGYSAQLNMVSLDCGFQFYASEQLISPFVSGGISPTYHWIGDIDNTGKNSVGAYVGLGLEMGDRKGILSIFELRFNMIFTNQDGIVSMPVAMAVKF